MPEMAKPRMDDWDWKLFGHDAEGGGLPTQRLDVPLPETAQGLYELSSKFAALSMELGRTARLTDDAPTALRNASYLLRSWRHQLKDIQREWETIVKERDRPPAENGEQNTDARRTAEAAE